MRTWESETAKLIEWGFSEDPGEWNDRVDKNEDDKVFYHKDAGRHRIAVLLSTINDGENVDAYVYVLQNIGCGYIDMPFPWTELDYKWLNAFKMSMDGKGLKGEKLYE